MAAGLFRQAGRFVFPRPKDEHESAAIDTFGRAIRSKMP